MNIENKKTALNDDAVLYQQNRDYATKENLKNLSGKQKWRYFLDYYWKKLLVAVIILVFGFHLLNTMVINPSECRLSLITINDCMVQQSEELGAKLKDYLGIENKNEYVSVEYFDTDNAQMNMVYTTRIAANATDLILCSYEDFIASAAQGIFINLADTLPEDMQKTLSDQFVEAQIIETDIDGNELSRGDAAPYGLDITGSALYEQFGGSGDQVILCIPVNSPNLKNAVKAISSFMET